MQEISKRCKAAKNDTLSSLNDFREFYINTAKMFNVQNKILMKMFCVLNISAYLCSKIFAFCIEQKMVCFAFCIEQTYR